MRLTTDHQVTCDFIRNVKADLLVNKFLHLNTHPTSYYQYTVIFKLFPICIITSADHARSMEWRLETKAAACIFSDFLACFF